MEDSAESGRIRALLRVQWLAELLVGGECRSRVYRRFQVRVRRRTATAQLCHGVPFAVLRIISDSADDNAHVDFPLFLGIVASFYSHHIIRRFLQDAWSVEPAAIPA